MDASENRTLSRRRFLAQAGVAGVAMVGLRPSALAATTEPPVAGSRSLRVIAYNVYKCTGWPKDRARAQKAYEDGQMPARIAREIALYDPDIINFSEAPEAPVVREMADELGMNHVFFQSAGNWPGALLTRFEIVEAENVPVAEGERPDDLFTRHWGCATVRLPGGATVVVHSAHLYPHDNPKSQALREREIAHILAAAEADVEAGRSLLLLGDLNHLPDTPEYEQWAEAGWVDTFAEVGDGAGPTINASEPDRRIDYVWAHGPIAEHITEARPLFEGAFRTNPSDPSSFALSDHLPQLAAFELDT